MQKLSVLFLMLLSPALGQASEFDRRSQFNVEQDIENQIRVERNESYRDSQIFVDAIAKSLGVAPSEITITGHLEWATADGSIVCAQQKFLGLGAAIVCRDGSGQSVGGVRVENGKMRPMRSRRGR